MYDETARDTLKDGTKVWDYLKKLGIVAGIKLDKGIVPLTGTKNENVTIGVYLKDLIKDALSIIQWESDLQNGELL